MQNQILHLKGKAQLFAFFETLQLSHNFLCDFVALQWVCPRPQQNSWWKGIGRVPDKKNSDHIESFLSTNMNTSTLQYFGTNMARIFRKLQLTIDLPDSVDLAKGLQEI